MKDEFYDHLVKVLAVGESGVGKTCIIQRYIKNEFSLNHLSTIAIDFKMKLIEKNGTKIKMQIWDTAGQERFNTLTSGFFRGIFKKVLMVLYFVIQLLIVKLLLMLING